MGKKEKNIKKKNPCDYEKEVEKGKKNKRR